MGTTLMTHARLVKSISYLGMNHTIFLPYLPISPPFAAAKRTPSFRASVGVWASMSRGMTHSAAPESTTIVPATRSAPLIN